jgi:phosphatidylglycerol---prolipoprotein diacylglyceryl transferase
VHPIAFYLGNWPVHWYGVLVAVGFMAGLWTASRRAPLTGLKPEHAADAGPWLILGAVVGARLLHIVTYWEQSYAGRPWTELLMVNRGGLVYYGGLIGASLAIIIYARVRRIRLWQLADVLAPSIPLGYVFGRIGCLMNGCCYGRACEAPWGINYPPNMQIQGPVHPTQIYDALLSLGLFLFLAWLYRRKKFDGQVFAAYLVCYAFTRSFVEYFRGDYGSAHLFAGVITPAQLISIAILVTGLTLFALLRTRRARVAASPRSS